MNSKQILPPPSSSATASVDMLAALLEGCRKADRASVAAVWTSIEAGPVSAMSNRTGASFQAIVETSIATVRPPRKAA